MENKFDLAAFHLIKQLYLEPYEKMAPGLIDIVFKSMILGESKEMVSKVNMHLSGKGEAIYVTVCKAYSRIQQYKSALIADVEYFNFSGFKRKNSSPFCLKMLIEAERGKRWNIRELLELRNGTNLPVIIFGGGEECHHDLDPDPFYKKE